MIVLYVLIAIAVLLIMVTIHELGHYLVGRRLGFKITEFSIGFGKVLWQKINKRGEKISLRLIPLGGFCSFYGEDGTEEDEPEKKEGEGAETSTPKPKKDESQYFTNQAPWKRILVFLAGVTFNFISAIIFSFILLVAFGYGNAYVVRDVNEHFVATASSTNQVAMLEKDDLILEIDGVKIDYIWGKTSDKLTSQTNGNAYSLTVKKGATGEIVNYTLEMQTGTAKVYDKDTNSYIDQVDKDGNLVAYTGLGVSMAMTSVPMNVWDALMYCVWFTIGLVWLVIKTLWLLITFQIPISSLGGTLTAVSVMAENMSQSFASVFVYLPLLAANLGAFNILPFPGLDGSHTAFTTVEWIRGKPINRDVEAWIHFIGMIILFAFVITLDLIHFLG